MGSLQADPWVGAKGLRKLVQTPGYASYQYSTSAIGDNLRWNPMFDSIESEKRVLLWARVRALILGIISFIPAFFLSLLVTIPWSKHYWAGDGQAVLGGIAVSFWFGIAFAVAASIYMLSRTKQRNRGQQR